MGLTSRLGHRIPLSSAVSHGLTTIDLPPHRTLLPGNTPILLSPHCIITVLFTIMHTNQETQYLRSYLIKITHTYEAHLIRDREWWDNMVPYRVPAMHTPSITVAFFLALAAIPTANADIHSRTAPLSHSQVRLLSLRQSSALLAMMQPRYYGWLFPLSCSYILVSLKRLGLSGVGFS